MFNNNSSSLLCNLGDDWEATYLQNIKDNFLQGRNSSFTNNGANLFIPQDQRLDRDYSYLLRDGTESPTAWSASSGAESPLSDILDFKGSAVNTPTFNTLEEMDYKTAVMFLTQLAEQVDQPNQRNTIDAYINNRKLPSVNTIPAISKLPEENYDAQLQELMHQVAPSKILYDPNNEPLDVPPPRRRSSAAVQAAQAANPPRPPNAFILYRRHQQAHLRASKPGVHLRVASKLIALWWKAESEQVKAHYRRVAQEEKAEHMKKYPEYRYKPRLDGRKRKEAPAIMGLVRRSSSIEKSCDLFDSFFQMPA